MHVPSLRRLSSAQTLDDMAREFNMSPKRISIICTHMVKRLNTEWGHILYRRLPCDYYKLRRYARAIAAKAGCNVTSIIGFIDCTIRGVARPTRWQRALYSGHKRYHALKYHGVMLPDGIMGRLFGPLHGAMYDSKILRKSRIERYLARLYRRAVSDNGHRKTWALVW
mmetsp:Transcript_48648/g.122857  ORF Transcript_48648/g.122857 Transcript_48648/m.122857 type:complete len:168 (+) Transcript_48648:370-873(+)